MKTKNGCQFRIKSDIDFPVYGDYCRYKLRVDAEYNVLGCAAAFNEHNLSVDHILKDEKKRKSFKSTKVNQNFFAEVGRSYGPESKKNLEMQHYGKLNGFDSGEAIISLCLFEVGFCGKQIKAALRMKHQANSLPTFGLPNEFWKNYDKYQSFFDFLASFRGNHAKFKTVLKSCIVSNPELFLRINSRPLIFRCLGDIDVNFFESYASTSLPNAIYLPQQFEYARAGFFTADQLTALQKTKIMCEETGNFVVTTTLLTCIATIQQLCANKKAYSRFSDYVVQLKTNFRKANVSYSDNKRIHAVHVLAGGEVYFEVQGESTKAYDIQRSDLRCAKHDVYIHNINCVSSQELAYILYYASNNISINTMWLVLSNDPHETKAWNTLRNIVDIPNQNDDDAQEVQLKVTHVQSVKDVGFAGICLTDIPLKTHDEEAAPFFERGECVYSLQYAIFGRVYKVSNGLITFAGHDFKVPTSACLKAQREDDIYLVPASCETRVKLSEPLGLIVTDEKRIRRLRKKMFMMSDDVGEVTHVLRSTAAKPTVDREFLLLFK